MARSPYTAKRGAHFGQKAQGWLLENEAQGVKPWTHEDLAALIGETQPRVSRALKAGDPKLSVARKIARVMGFSLEYLADPDIPWPMPADVVVPAWLGALTADERRTFARRASSPGVREMLTGGPGAGRDPHAGSRG